MKTVIATIIFVFFANSAFANDEKFDQYNAHNCVILGGAAPIFVALAKQTPSDSAAFVEEAKETAMENLEGCKANGHSDAYIDAAKRSVAHIAITNPSYDVNAATLKAMAAELQR